MNTEEKRWDEKKISYEQVIVLAFGSYEKDDKIAYTVDYLKGSDSHHEGSLTEGKDVPVKNGMIFNVSRTNRS